MDAVGIMASQYCAAGWSLVAFDRGSKGPAYPGWNLPQRCVTDPAEAAAIEGQNIGLAHAYSRTAAIDLDDTDLAAEWLGAHGIDLQELLDAPDAVMISSGRERRGKLLYRLPADVEPLPSKRLDGNGIELRCGTTTGLTVQDVLPPSTHPVTGKPYTWVFGPLGHWSALPELPDALLGLWKSLLRPAEGRERPAPSGANPERLRGILARLDPDMGYNDWVKVGMVLHHETEGEGEGLLLWDEWSRNGQAYKGLEDLEPHWRSFGRSATPVTLGWLMSQAGGADPDEFDDLTAIPEPPKKKRFEILSLTEYASGPPPKWFIKGVLAKAGLGILYGESGAGKSFAVLDMMLAIASGEPWNGKRVTQGRIVYVCAEGQDGFRQRVRAYAKFFGVDVGRLSIGVISDVPNLLDDKHQKTLAARINEWGGADLVVIDTLAQTTPGSNENSSEDMGKALAHCRLIHAATGAMVLLVHHAGKDASRGARGWSGIRAAADTEIEVSNGENGRVIRVSKQKDGQEGLTFPFQLLDVHLGEDEDGDPITSCVVDYSAGDMPTGDRRPRGVWQQQVWKAVLEGCELTDGTIPVDVVLQRAVESMPREPGQKDRRRANATRALEALIARDWVVVQGVNLAIKGAL